MEKERPDALLPTMGGQKNALNLATALAKSELYRKEEWESGKLNSKGETDELTTAYEWIYIAWSS